MEQFADWCTQQPDVKMVSVYALSTENLNRDPKEVNKLWEVYKKEFERILSSDKIRENNVRINIVGNSAVWRSDVRQAAKAVMTSTKNYTRIVLNVLLAYGGQFEIVNSVKKMIKAGIKSVPAIEKSFHNFLLINKPVDLVIRTGGEQRLSNFLLYQSAYSEIYFTPTLWPDFSKKEFNKVLKWYRSRKKNYGR